MCPDLDISNPYGFVDKRVGRGLTAGTTAAEIANMSSVSVMKTRLAAINGTTFTAARLASMTENDCIYALRVASSDVAGI